MRLFHYFINLNERGEFFADIRDLSGETLLEIDSEYAEFLTQEKINVLNVTSVRDYFRSIGDLPSDAILINANGLK